MGWRCSDTAELTFDETPIELFDAGHGFAALARHFARERLQMAMIGYATAQRCLDLSVRWAHERQTFGAPLLERQVVRHQLVEMHRLTDVTRQYCRWVVVRAARGESVPAEAALAKQTAAQACLSVADTAVQLFGGLGYMTGTEVERHYRDARILSIGGGSTAVMTDLVAQLLGYHSSSST